MPKRVVGSAVLTITIGLGLATSWALADPIEDRQAVMKRNGKAAGEIAAIAKGDAPFDAAVVKKNAEIIAKDLEEFKDLFPEGTQTGDKETYAKPEIWSDRAGFEAARMRAHDAAMALAAVTDEAGFAPALGNLGNACMGCHEKYRRPRE